jgi:DNA-binding Xre family transcriptional regulator
MEARVIRVTVDELLHKQGLSIKKLAEIAGLRYQTVFDFVKGNTQGVDWTTLDAICKALRVAPGDIIRWHE